MEISKLQKTYEGHKQVQYLQEKLAEKDGEGRFFLKGISQSALALVVASASNAKRVNVILFAT